MLPLGSVKPHTGIRKFLALLPLAAALLAGAASIALGLGPDVQMAAAPVHTAAPPAQAAAPALPGTVAKGLPKGWKLTALTPQADALWGGKLLLIDEEHPVPKEAPPPNTLGIAARGEGRIAVRSPSHVTDEEVIGALARLFEMGKEKGIKSWLVWEGTRSPGQQLALQMERLALHAQSMPLSEAAAMAAREVPAPGHSEHQLPFVVDIRLAEGWNATPDQTPLSASPEGRLLLDTAWAYGFIHRYGDSAAPPYQDEAYHFRYVGVAHSTLMHALQLDFPGYLAFLREAGEVTLYEEGIPRYAVLCKRYAKGLTFSIPQGCEWEASMDNTGYAVVALTFPREQ